MNWPLSVDLILARFHGILRVQNCLPFTAAADFMARGTATDVERRESHCKGHLRAFSLGHLRLQLSLSEAMVKPRGR